jgi:polysaccharide biosynthesis/export protein
MPMFGVKAADLEFRIQAVGTGSKLHEKWRQDRSRVKIYDDISRKRNLYRSEQNADQTVLVWSVEGIAERVQGKGYLSMLLKKIWLYSIVWTFAFSAHGTASASEYRLQPGDVLDISVASVADLQQRVAIGVDGRISFPLIGQLHVSDMTVSDVQETLASLLPQQLYQSRTQDGREHNVTIIAQEITVRVAEYTPVYMRGDVAQPGELVFRPGMTARQAIALAGGYDIMRFRMNNPFLESSDLRSEYNSLWLEYAQLQTQLARLDAEMEGRNELSGLNIDAPIPQSVLERTIAIETEHLRNRMQEIESMRAFTRKAVEDAEEQARVLEESARRSQEGAEADQAELTELTALLQRGTVPATRVTDARRASLLSTTQWLQTSVQAATTRQQALELERDLERAEAERFQEILRDRQDLTLRMSVLRSRLSATAEKLLYTGAVRTQLVRGQGSDPQVVIFRRGEPGGGAIAADEDTELRPGDVVDVMLDLAPIDAVSNR